MVIAQSTWTETIETETARVRYQVIRWHLLGIPLFTRRSEVSRKGAAISQELRQRVLWADAYQCVYCGTHYMQELAIDHRVPQVDGGETSEGNLQTACRSCNSRKGGRTPEEASMLPRFGRYLSGVAPQERAAWNDIWQKRMYDESDQAYQQYLYQQRTTKR